jgi:Methyltransferase domain
LAGKSRSTDEGMETLPEESPVISAISYWQPSRIVPSGWIEHAPFAFWVMSALRPKTLVELGTHNGYSFFAFCEAAVRLGLDTTSYAIDTWEGDDHAGFYGNEVYEEVKAVKAALYEDSAWLLRGYFDDFVDSFDDGSIDLLHIDGRHGYEDVKYDFESWLPKLSDSGIVLFHDIVVREREFGVWKFWAQLTKKYPSFGFTHGNGLGVLSVGTTVPINLAPLFSASKQEIVAIRAFYAQRGAAITAVYIKEMALRGEIDAVHESWSWRVTRPLRAVSRYLPIRGRRAFNRGRAR